MQRTEPIDPILIFTRDFGVGGEGFFFFGELWDESLGQLKMMWWVLVGGLVGELT